MDRELDPGPQTELAHGVGDVAAEGGTGRRCWAGVLRDEDIDLDHRALAETALRASKRWPERSPSTRAVAAPAQVWIFWPALSMSTYFWIRRARVSEVLAS